MRKDFPEMPFFHRIRAALGYTVIISNSQGIQLYYKPMRLLNARAKNIFAVVFGSVLGCIVGILVLLISPVVIPSPNDTDVTLQTLRNTLPYFAPKHFIFPFFAHAIGTFAGALAAALGARTLKMRNAIIVGFIFMIGGIVTAFIIPLPFYFLAFDILFAYLIPAYYAGKLAIESTRPPTFL